MTTRCGKRVVINATHRQKNARTRVHLCTIRRKLRMLLRPSSMFLKDAIRFCAPNRFAETSSAYGHVCASADVWTKNGLVWSTAERKSKRESHRKRFDETKSLKRSNYKFVSQQSGSCANGRGHISFWITIIKMVPVTYVLLIDSHLLLFVHVCKICFL